MPTVPFTGVAVPGGGLELQVIKLKAVTGSTKKKNQKYDFKITVCPKTTQGLGYKIV